MRDGETSPFPLYILAKCPIMQVVGECVSIYCTSEVMPNSGVLCWQIGSLTSLHSSTLCIPFFLKKILQESESGYPSVIKLTHSLLQNRLPLTFQPANIIKRGGQGLTPQKKAASTLLASSNVFKSTENIQSNL